MVNVDGEMDSSSLYRQLGKSFGLGSTAPSLLYQMDWVNSRNGYSNDNSTTNGGIGKQIVIMIIINRGTDYQEGSKILT